MSFQYADDTFHKRECQQNVDDAIMLQVEFLYQRTHSDPCERCEAAECGNKQFSNHKCSQRGVVVCDVSRQSGHTAQIDFHIDAHVIHHRSNRTFQTYHSFQHHLRSTFSVVEEHGHQVFSAEYDAWGKQTVSVNTIGLIRGYGGHEIYSYCSDIDE